MSKDKKEELSTTLTVPLYTDNKLKEVIKYAEEGNIQAQLSLILHNQRIINIKLNKLLPE